MRKILPRSSGATLDATDLVLPGAKGSQAPGPWNKGLVKLNKTQKDQESMFSIAETSETYKSSCFMGTLRKVLPKSILKAQNPVTYGNHYVCSAVYLAQCVLLPSP